MIATFFFLASVTWLLCMDTAHANLSGSCHRVTVPPPGVDTTHFSEPMISSIPETNLTIG